MAQYTGINIFHHDIPLLAQVEALHLEAFGDDSPSNEPVLGEKDEDLVAPSVAALLLDRGNFIVGLINEHDSLVGFSLAMPVDHFDDAREKEHNETAYVYWTAIRKDLQGQGLVQPLQAKMHERLISEGFTAFEEDVMIENGYAANVIIAYAGSIAFIEPHRRWEDIGYQARVKIDLTHPEQLP